MVQFKFINKYNRLISSIVLLPSIFYIILAGGHFFNFFLLICLFFSILEWSKFKSNKLIIFFGIIYLFFSFYLTYKFRINDNQDNLLIFFLITSLCISTDIGGFIFGKTLKGPKITKISPNKTYTGFLGAILLSIFVYYLFLFFFHNELSTNKLINIFFVINLSILSQIGDLFISYFKRKSNIKDTGKIIPGHGGVLDRIDGMIFVFPISYIYLYL